MEQNNEFFQIERSKDGIVFENIARLYDVGGTLQMIMSISIQTKIRSMEMSAIQGIPTVQFLSDHFNISPSYLSDMLRSLTGRNAQQHIHDKLIEKAKEKLSITSLTVSEVAYELGFEHPQSFIKLFKTKASISPLKFRQSFY